MRLILDTTECKIDGDTSIGNDTSRLFLEVDKLLHEIKAFFKEYTKNGRQVTALFEASIGYVPIMTQKKRPLETLLHRPVAAQLCHSISREKVAFSCRYHSSFPD